MQQFMFSNNNEWYYVEKIEKTVNIIGENRIFILGLHIAAAEN